MTDKQTMAVRGRPYSSSFESCSGAVRPAVWKMVWELTRWQVTRQIHRVRSPVRLLIFEDLDD